MNSQISEAQSVDFSVNIRELFLGVREADGRVIVNTYLGKQVIEERLMNLIVSFTYQGEEITFEVEELQRGIPMRLVLRPLSNFEVVEEFLRNVLSVCLVPAVTFIERGETHVVKNSRYNPNCLN